MLFVVVTLSSLFLSFPILILINCCHSLSQLLAQPRSQGSLLPALRFSLSRSLGRVGENPGNDVAPGRLLPYQQQQQQGLFELQNC